MAFTLSNDLDRQESIYQDMKGSYFAPHVIRRRLVDSDMNTKHELVKFVTLNAYQKAGGTVTSDLFQECSYINDPELIEKHGDEIDAGRAGIGLDADQTHKRAACCQPVPGERIVGITYRGQGVVVHGIDCPVLSDLADNPERWVDLHWHLAAWQRLS